MDEACYVIIYGSVRATCEDKSLRTDINVGDMFGEISAYLCLPPHTQLCAMDHCLACRIPVGIFNSFMNAHSEFRTWVKQYATDRIRRWKQIADPV